MEEDITILEGLPGWTVESSVATYRPVEGGWLARVRLVAVLGHTYSRWHVALIDSRGAAHYTRLISYLADARRMAEGLVRSQNLG